MFPLEMYVLMVLKSLPFEHSSAAAYMNSINCHKRHKNCVSQSQHGEGSGIPCPYGRPLRDQSLICNRTIGNWRLLTEGNSFSLLVKLLSWPCSSETPYIQGLWGHTNCSWSVSFLKRHKVGWVEKDAFAFGITVEYCQSTIKIKTKQKQRKNNWANKIVTYSEWLVPLKTKFKYVLAFYDEINWAVMMNLGHIV